MKLISIEMENFRQHLNSKITFSDGVTGIIGANGSGKSTILEAIAWALYGAPAVRGTNDTIRSRASEGGAKASVSLTFDMSGTIYKATRTLDGSGKNGSAVLEVDKRPLKSGMSEVTTAIGKLLGMDYQAFFTSFFTGQKQIEFMSQMEGRQRANAISRMLGYDRLTRARDKANEDRKGLQREIDGLEKGLADPEEIKQRKKEASTQLSDAKKALCQFETLYKNSQQKLDKLKPLKESSDQKSKRNDEISRRLEIDRADVARYEVRIKQLRSEESDLNAKSKELDSMQDAIDRFEQAKNEYRKLFELQKFEGERQRLSGQIASLKRDIDRLTNREKALIQFQDLQKKLSSELLNTENSQIKVGQDIQLLREQKIAQQHSLQAQISQNEIHIKEIAAKRDRIKAAGASGICPTCERPLADELPKVLSNFDSQVNEIIMQSQVLQKEKSKIESDTSKQEILQQNFNKISQHIDELKKAKSEADARVVEINSIRQDIKTKSSDTESINSQLAKLPIGFDQERYRELQHIGEELRPIHEKAIALKSALDRGPAVKTEIEEIIPQYETKKKEIANAQQALSELAFSVESHEKLTQDFNEASDQINKLHIELERQNGEVKTASAVLLQIEKEEDTYKTKLEELKSKRIERLNLQTLAEAFDKLRIELNDRIRPELESIASELMSVMTDGRYNVLEIDDNYKAIIRDDGELKPVISGGEDDIVNLSLRLAISQMIAERAGQSFSLLILDEVFGSLDDTRRDNVVALLQNLKNRFEQIILITHVESIHDEMDNCIWIEFDEKTKTSRLADKSTEEQLNVEAIV